MFVHGWENNASEGPPENHFVQGTKDLMNLLKAQYQDVWVEGEMNADDPNGKTPSRCIHADNEQYRQQKCTLLHHPVVGVYISWRGAIASEYWPVSQVLSYWNRRDTAYRVGNTNLTDAVMQLSAIAHPKTANPNFPTPYVLMIGHSFGALVLERALSQAYMRMVSEQLSASPATPNQPSFLADLVVYVNSAAASTEAKQVIDLLAQARETYTTYRGGPRYPSFLSVSSVTDMVTKDVLPVGQSVTAAGEWAAGSSRRVSQVCFNPESETKKTGAIDVASQGDYLKHTAPHFEPLQSHEVVALNQQEFACIQKAACAEDPPVANCKKSDPGYCITHPVQLKKGDPGLKQDIAQSKCERVAQSIRESNDDGPSLNPDIFGPLFIPREHIYPPEATKVVNPKDPTGNCYLIEPKNLATPNAPRCNGTPYFVMEIPHDMIPDHPTIFTVPFFVSFVSLFLPPPVSNTSRKVVVIAKPAANSMLKEPPQ